MSSRQYTRFLDYLQYERRYSAHTMAAYRKDLQQFEAWLMEQDVTIDLLKVHAQQIRGWVMHMVEEGLKARSIKRKLSAVKSYYAYAKKQGWVDINPAQAVSGPAADALLPAFVRESQMDLLLDPANFDDSFAAQRDRMVLEILYGLGLRRNELVKLSDSDIDTVSSTIRIAGKGNKVRILPISQSLMKLILHYQQLRDQHFGHSPQATFIRSNKGNNAYAGLIYRIVRQHLQGMTTLSSQSPHLLRHTFATHLSNHGAPLNAIKELLGHSSLAATQTYMHNSIERLQKVYDQAHPKGDES